jgi:hypothetical protein
MAQRERERITRIDEDTLSTRPRSSIAGQRVTEGEAAKK